MTTLHDISVTWNSVQAVLCLEQWWWAVCSQQYTISCTALFGGVCPFQALLLLHSSLSFHTRVISSSAEDSSVLNSHKTLPMCNTEQACRGSRLSWFVKSSVFRTAVSGFQTCAKQLCVCFSDGDYSLGSPYCFLYYMAYWFCKL